MAGYSQGALVIHLALRRLDRDGETAILNQIAAVMLLADPAKVSDPAEETWEAPHQPAGNGVRGAEGIWKYSFGDKGPLPSEVTGRTIAYCRNHDAVCAPGQLRYLIGLGVGNAASLAWADKSVHTSYDSTDLRQVGERAADLFLP